MCAIDDSERSDKLTKKIRTARKTHQCGECLRIIQPGEKYEYYAGVSDGEIFTAKTCTHCMAARSWLVVNCEGWLFGGVLDDLDEHWDYEIKYRSLDLGKKIVGMRKQWQGKYGLLSIPKLTTQPVA